MKKYSLYEQEQNKLLYDFLMKKDKKSFMVEFIISSYCNQSCEYCYLYKYGKDLYPSSIQNFDEIINNFKILVEWLDEQHFQYEDYDLFSGEFFNLPIWEDIFEILYNHEKERLENNKNEHPRTISCPTNMSFLMDNNKTKKIENWIQKFNDLGSALLISCSVEGPEDLEKLERPLKTSQKQDENFYKKFISFRKKYSLSSHPMVTKNFVKNYKQNYDWWIDTTIENNIIQKNTKLEDVYAIPMFLEVRDAEQWDEESLNNYKKFLKYVAEKDLKTIHNNNLNDFAEHIFDYNIDIPELSIGKYNKVQPYIINYPYLTNRMQCSIQNGPVFRIGDLAYVPCHRTMYPHFIYGHLIKEDNKIIGIEANKPTLAIKIKNLNPNRSILKCSNCPINPFCLKQCLGSQYEHTNELFCADERICDLFYIKYKTIYEIIQEYDLYNWVKKSTLFTPKKKEFIDYVRRVITKL